MAKDQNLFNERASRPKFDCYFIGKDLRDDPRFADFVRRFERAKSDRVERRTNDRTIG